MLFGLRYCRLEGEFRDRTIASFQGGDRRSEGSARPATLSPRLSPGNGNRRSEGTAERFPMAAASRTTLRVEAGRAFELEPTSIVPRWGGRGCHRDNEDKRVGQPAATAFSTVSAAVLAAGRQHVAMSGGGGPPACPAYPLTHRLVTRLTGARLARQGTRRRSRRSLKYLVPLGCRRHPSLIPGPYDDTADHRIFCHRAHDGDLHLGSLPL